MTLSKVTDPKALRKFVEGNPKLVKKIRSQRFPGLFVLKYSKEVFFSNLWNEFLIDCRGLVINDDYEIIAWPFTKVFNRHENGMEFDRDDICIWVEKINGFMASLTISKEIGEVIVSTTGSTDSEHVELARKALTPVIEYWEHRLYHLDDSNLYSRTEIYEICTPEDPHIIQEKEGAYLIGARDLDTGKMWAENGLDSLADMYMCEIDDCIIIRPEWGVARYSDVVDMSKECKHEGYMVHNFDGRILKLKSPHYKISKLFARRKDVTSLLQEGNKQNFEEEFYALMDNIRENVHTFNLMDEQERLNYIRKFLENE